MQDLSAYKRGVRVYDKGMFGVITKRRYINHPLYGQRKIFYVEVKWDEQGLEIVDPTILQLESNVIIKTCPHCGKTINAKLA